MFITRVIFALLAVCLASATPEAEDRSSSVTTVKLVKKHGYPIEEHTVQTADGYLLTMHRIPHSIRDTDTTKQRPVVFLMHGVLCTSSDYILAGPGVALGYLLSDAGYDVWLGNARGNTYSKRHATKSHYFQPFWNFSWHEIAIYDIPAMIDYILYVTGQPNLRYVGHSQGTTVFLVLNSLTPSYRNRIRSAHLLAPVAFMDNMNSPIALVTAPVFGHANPMVELFGSAEFLPNTRALELLGMVACRDAMITQAICTNVVFLLGGYNSPYLNKTMIPEISATTPAGCSINQLWHFLQEYNSGHFRQFDYGFIRNKIVYGSMSPPDYNLKNINVPTYLYYSDNDYFAHVDDVARLIDNLPKEILKDVFRLPQKKWNHLDFLWGINVKEFVYDKVLEDIRNS